jgi:hypothetical protein
MLVRGQCFHNATLLHDYETRTVHETPALILAPREQSPRPLVENNVDMNNVNVRRGFQPIDKGDDRCARNAQGAGQECHKLCKDLIRGDYLAPLDQCLRGPNRPWLGFAGALLNSEGGVYATVAVVAGALLLVMPLVVALTMALGAGLVMALVMALVAGLGTEVGGGAEDARVDIAPRATLGGEKSCQRSHLGARHARAGHGTVSSVTRGGDDLYAGRGYVYPSTVVGKTFPPVSAVGRGHGYDVGVGRRVERFA